MKASMLLKRKALLPVFIGGVSIALALMLVWLAACGENGAGPSSSSPLRIESVSVTRGTNHIFYFPNALRYHARSLYVWLQLPRIWEFAPLLSAQSLEVRSHGDCTVFWATISGSKNPLEKPISMRFKDSGGTIHAFPPHQAIWQANRNGGLIWGLISNAPPDLSGCELQIETETAEAKFRFK
jgi:hypothetical protein